MQRQNSIAESRGKVIFETKCAGCHGTYGNGRTTADASVSTNFNAAYHFLNPQPRDFTTAAFKSRTTPSGALPTDEDIFRTAEELGIDLSRNERGSDDEDARRPASR